MNEVVGVKNGAVKAGANPENPNEGSESGGQTNNSANTDNTTSGAHWYALAVLTIIYAFNFIDRQILVILQEQIRADLGLMDWQLGLLSGFAFALFYVVVGLPVAQLAERRSRKNIVSIALLIWSGMTALSGAAQNFFQLLLIRVGVGVGESGGSPPSHSMISDMFPAEKRGTALSIYSSGLYLGLLIGFSVGGWLAVELGWRLTFVVAGVPGILLALLLFTTVKEPPRGRLAGGQVSEVPSFKETLTLLWSKKSFRYLSLASSMHALASYGATNFFPSFVIRNYDMAVDDLGWRLAIVMGLGGMIGMVGSGFLSDRLAKKDARWNVWVPALAVSASLPFYVFTLLFADLASIFYVYFIAVLLAAAYLGQTIAVTHALVGTNQRAVSSAVLFFIINLLGLGVGPVVVGAISDILRPTLGDGDGIRYALMSVVAVANISCVGLYWMSSRTLRDDIASTTTAGS